MFHIDEARSVLQSTPVAPVHLHPQTAFTGGLALRSLGEAGRCSRTRLRHSLIEPNNARRFLIRRWVKS